MIAFWVLSFVACASAGAFVARGFSQPRSRIVAVLVVALGALGVFAVAGGAHGPSMPLSQRLDRLDGASLANLPPDAWLAAAQAQAKRNPTGPSLRAYGEALLINGRARQAQRVLSQSIQLSASPGALVSLAEAIVIVNGGQVTERALQAAQDALALDPDNLWAGNFVAMAALQQGDTQAAAEHWIDLLGKAQGRDDSADIIAMRAAQALSRPQAIGGAAPAGADPRNMVAGLAERLIDERDDLAGWLMLARSRAVLDGRGAGEETLAAARAAFAEKPGALLILSSAPNSWPQNAATYQYIQDGEPETAP